MQIEAALASGAQQRQLRAYFGAAEYRALSTLARGAQAVPVAARAPRVLIVPGIMGSQLGLRRPAPLPADIVWLDPLDIQLGRLAALAVPGPPIVPLGVVLFSYLRLKLFLRGHGFAVQFHDYDWRLPVAELGGALAARLRSLAGARVALVAHSMGGLVSRAALAHPGTQHVERVVLLGTPNSGSFAAVQALRGTYAVVRKVARLALHASAEELANGTFSSFPSLYDLLPWGECAGRLDLFDVRAWPRGGPRPRAALLQAARAAHAQLAPADRRFAVIAGVGQETVTAVTRRNDDFIYTLTRHGDGTVPLASAQLPGATHVYARSAHSELTRDRQVAAAVVDLLRHGTTARLPRRWHSASRARTQVSDRRLRASHTHKVNWAALTPRERRLFLENLNEPPRFRLRVPRRRRRA
ncbi:MAG TPA: hypothetical protein VK803_03845 [Steroidobacteraceae bacterium]|nr:hypothetical protein [Steroidobacteraceae bacterium]